MPTIDITLRKGCSDEAIEKCLLQIPRAAEDILENTKTRMLRVSVFEAEPEMILQDRKMADGIFPTVVFTIGPGRSEEAKKKFAQKITDILVENLKCRQEEVRVYTLSSAGNHFAIGGKPKVFPKLPEAKKEEN